MRRPTLPALATFIALSTGCPHNELGATTSDSIPAISTIQVNLDETNRVAQEILDNIEGFCHTDARIANPSMYASAAFPLGSRSVYYSNDTFTKDCVDHVLGHTWKNLGTDTKCSVVAFDAICTLDRTCIEESQIAIQCD